MAPPNWLPPLNSHHQHEIHVKISPQNPMYHPALLAPFFWMKTSVTVEFKSDKSTRIFEGLSCNDFSFFPCSKLNSTWLSSSIINHILDTTFVPFELTLDKDELVEIILLSARSMLQSTSTDCYNILPFKLEFIKEVEVPDYEFESWISWYDAKTRADPDFERDYMEAIRRPRTFEELLDEITLESVATAKSCIEGLEEVTVHASSSNSDCLICLEELLLGSKATRLPCSHMFHGDCIVKWLQEYHTCPLCRFPLPSA